MYTGSRFPRGKRLLAFLAVDGPLVAKVFDRTRLPALSAVHAKQIVAVVSGHAAVPTQENCRFMTRRSVLRASVPSTAFSVR